MIDYPAILGVKCVQHVKSPTVWLSKSEFIEWLACCLSEGPDLWKRMPLKCSTIMVFTRPLLSWCKISSPSGEMVVFPIPFHTFMLLVNLWFIRLQGEFPILRARTCPELYPLIRPPRKPLALEWRRILIPRFIRSPPMLVVYDTAHSLPLWGVDRGFPFIKTRRHFSYFSGTFRE